MTRPKVSPDKRQRTARACDMCKRRKQKCDGQNPCATCQKKGTTCLYGSGDEASENGPSPKKLMIETSNTYASPQKVYGPHTGAPLQQTFTWTPTSIPPPGSSEMVSADMFHKSQSSQSTNAFTSPANDLHGTREEMKIATSEVNVNRQRSDSNTSLPPQDVELYHQTRMLQDPSGQLLYFGDSSTLSFLHLVRMIVAIASGPSGFTEDKMRHRIVENRLIMPEGKIPLMFPHRDTADLLLKCYYTNVSGLFEIFDREEFGDQLNQCYADPLAVDSSWLCLFYLTFAVGLVTSVTTPGSPDDEIINKLRIANHADLFYLHAKNLEDPLTGFEHAPFRGIQALTLMSVYTLAVSRRTSACVFHANAVSSAIAHGLHREETIRCFDPVVQNVRRNLWRTLFVLDRFLAASLGRPLSIQESACSTAILSSEQQSGRQRTTPAGSSPNTGQMVSTSTQLPCLDAAVESSHVLGFILENVYSKRRISTKLTEGIIDRCKEWHNAWDSSLRFRHQNFATNPSLGIGMLHVNLLHYHCILLLTRPFFSMVMNSVHQKQHDTKREKISHRKVLKFAEICVQSGSRIIEFIQAAFGGQYLPKQTPFIMYFLFAAAVVVIANEFSALFQNSNATTDIDNAIRIMRHFSISDVQGKRLLEILESFRNVVHDEQAKRGPQTGQPPSGQLASGNFAHFPSQTNAINDPTGTFTDRHQIQPLRRHSLDSTLNHPFSDWNMPLSPTFSAFSHNRNSSYVSNSSYVHSTPSRNSISLDSLLDLNHAPAASHSGSNSDHPDSTGEHVEFSFDEFWQQLAQTRSAENIAGSSMPSVGVGDIEGISAESIPLFGVETNYGVN